jgi:predicted ATPase
VLFGLRGFYASRAEYKTARELGEQCLTLAKSVQDPTLLLLAHLGLGVILFFLGEFTLARKHLEQGIALYDPQQHNPHASHTAQDPGVVCLTYAAWILWLLGYPDQALKRSPEALTLAQELSHPYSLAWALNLGAKVHQWRREGQATQELTETWITLSHEHGFPYFLAEGTFLRGSALAEQGQVEEGIAQMRQGLAAFRAMETNPGRAY